MDPRIVLEQASQTWRCPVELDRSRPREACLTWGGRFTAGLALILLLAGLAAGIGLYAKFSHDQETMRQIIRSGSDTQAKISRAWISNGKSRAFYVGYAYQVDGKVYFGRRSTNRASWLNLQHSGMLTIRYLPVDPAKHMTPGYEPDLPPPWAALIAAGGLFSLSWMLVRIISRQRYLLAEGQCAPAVVMRIKNCGHGKKMAYYTFVDRNGKLLDGKAGPHRAPPPIGTTISVIYDPDREKHNHAYPLPFVQLRRDSLKAP